MAEEYHEREKNIKWYEGEGKASSRRKRAKRNVRGRKKVSGWRKSEK